MKSCLLIGSLTVPFAFNFIDKWNVKSFYISMSRSSRVARTKEKERGLSSRQLWGSFSFCFFGKHVGVSLLITNTLLSLSLATIVAPILCFIWRRVRKIFKCRFRNSDSFFSAAAFGDLFRAFPSFYLQIYACIMVLVVVYVKLELFYWFSFMSMHKNCFFTFF